MPVVRITATKKWHAAAARAVADHRRLARELERAAERPGLTAELQGPEVQVLAEALPGDDHAAKALAEMQVLEARERGRPHARDLVLGKWLT